MFLQRGQSASTAGRTVHLSRPVLCTSSRHDPAMFCPSWSLYSGNLCNRSFCSLLTFYILATYEPFPFRSHFLHHHKGFPSHLAPDLFHPSLKARSLTRIILTTRSEASGTCGAPIYLTAHRTNTSIEGGLIFILTTQRDLYCRRVRIEICFSSASGLSAILGLALRVGNPFQALPVQPSKATRPS